MIDGNRCKKLESRRPHLYSKRLFYFIENHYIFSVTIILIIIKLDMFITNLNKLTIMF